MCDVTRLVGCPKKWEFLKNGMNMVDVLAIMPYYVELFMSQQANILQKNGQITFF